MSAKDWYARRLGNPPPAAPSTPPAGHPGPYVGPQPPSQQQQSQDAAAQAMARGDVVGAAQFWQGGEGTRTEHERCPNCGSANYFSRTNRPAAGVNVGGGASGRIVTTNGVMQVAARCFDCNHNGLYDLQG